MSADLSEQQVTEMLTCPACGDSLAYHPSESHDEWECDDCHCHGSAKWIYTVDELDVIYEAKQEAAKCNSQ